jgi:4-amino-4-deoxy-L-arabinose transferase-like glycosyltransferase
MLVVFSFVISVFTFILNLYLINQGSGFTIPRELLFRTDSSLVKPILACSVSLPIVLLLYKLVKNSKFINKFQEKIIFIGSLLYSFSLFWTVQTNPDFGRYHKEAEYLVENGIVGFIQKWGYFQTYFDMPVIPFLYGVGYFLLGSGKFAVLIVNLFVFLGIIIFTYLTAKELFNKRIARLSVVFFSFAPYIATQTPLMLVDLGQTFFTILCFYLILKLIKKPDWKITAITVLSLFACALTKVFSAIYLLSIFAISFFIAYQQNSKSIKPLAFTWIASGFAGFGYGWWKQELFLTQLLHRLSPERFLNALLPLATFAVFIILAITLFKKQISHILKKHQNKLIVLFYLLLAYLFFFSDIMRFYLRTPFIAMTIPLAVLFYLSIYFAFKKKNYPALALLPWAFTPLFIPNTMFKYQLAAYPAIMMLSSFSLVNLFKNKEKQVKYVLVIISFSISILFFFFLPMIQKHVKNNLRAAGRYINKQNAQAVVVLFDPKDEYGEELAGYIDEKSKAPTPSLIHLLDFWSDTEFEYQTEDEFLQYLGKNNNPDAVILATNFYKQFEFENSELKKKIEELYQQGPVFDEHKTGAGIWRVKLKVLNKKPN